MKGVLYMLNGSYDLTVLAMGQEKKGAMTLVEDNGNLSGSIETMGMKLEFSEGVADGDNYRFTVSAQNKKLEFWGKIDENGKVDGEGKMGFISMVVLGQRQ